MDSHRRSNDGKPPPSPADWAILQKLLHDNDEEAREAAQAVVAALTTLRETPPAQLADKERGPVRQ